MALSVSGVSPTTLQTSSLPSNIRSLLWLRYMQHPPRSCACRKFWTLSWSAIHTSGPLNRRGRCVERILFEFAEHTDVCSILFATHCPSRYNFAALTVLPAILAGVGTGIWTLLTVKVIAASGSGSLRRRLLSIRCAMMHAASMPGSD